MNLSQERFVRVLASLKPDDGVAVDNRRSPRVALRSTVLMAPYFDGRPGAAFTVRLQDVSSGGAAVHALRAVPCGSEFILDLPEQSATEAGAQVAPLRILCRVAHCRRVGQHQFQLGLEFSELWTAPAPSLDAARAAA